MSVLKYLSVFLIGSLLLVGCSKKSNNPLDSINDCNNGENPVSGQAQVLVSGGGFNNSTITFHQGVSYYIPSEEVTYVEFLGASVSDTIVVSIVFPGSEEGVFDWAENSQTAFIITGSSTGGKVFTSTNSGETNVSNYGDINQNIVGTISGIMKNSVSENDDITVDGTFSLKRLPDVNE